VRPNLPQGECNDKTVNLSLPRHAPGDIVIRHFSYEVNLVLKPLQLEGPFLSTLDKGAVLKLATKQSGRELAVVILLKSNTSDPVKQDWLKIFREVGYQRVVFLRADAPGLKIDGLPVLASAKTTS
jgi:hypothetical protein